MRFLRLGAAGMRGEIGAGLTPPLAIDFSSALGTYLEGGKILISSDTRFSSTMLRHAVFSALVSCGCEVVNAGISPAPVIHFLTPHLNADGALLLGAGHHPAGWNALVPISAEGAYFNSIQLQELLDVYHGHRYRNCAWDSIGKVIPAPEDADESYLDMLCSKIDVDAIASRKFKVIADFCNGSGSRFSESFAKRLGIELIPVNDDESGILPHDPEPRPRSSAQVHSIMKPLKADAGFVFNTDMSRAAVVTSSGETLSEEYTFPLVANHVLASGPKRSSVVTNCCTTRTLDEIVKRHKGILHKTKVGQAFVIDKMFQTKAALAGDGSGSVALSGAAPGFDGFLAMALVLEAMAVNKCSSAELAEDLPRYHIVKKKIHCPSAHAYSLLRSVRNSYPEAEFSEDDGFRFDWKDGWVHLRASVTEPVVRMMVEWKNKDEAEDRALHIRGGLERLVSG
jgi:phosphomannomutase